MDVRNFFRRLTGIDNGRLYEAEYSHRRLWEAHRAALPSWNEDNEDDAWLAEGQSSSGREPRRVVRASGRVGADRNHHRYSR